MLSGPVLGAAGAWLGRRYPGSAAPAVGALVAGEVVGVALLQGHRLAPAPLYFTWGVSDWRPYIAESLVGVAIMVTDWWRRRSRALGVHA